MEARTDYFLAEMRKVGAALTKETTVFMFGGGVMALLGLKEQTKDLDLVVLGRASGERLYKAFGAAGYHIKHALSPTYRQMHARAVLDNLEGFRIDLFVDRICRALDFSSGMESRSKALDLGLPLLDLRLASAEDVFILKSVTDRPRDLDDMAALAERPLDWKAIEREMIAQRRTGGKFFMPVFLQSLEALQADHGVDIPILPAMLDEVQHDLDEIEARNEADKRAHREKAARK
jgi:hypothetical protein